jgi:hypothetical protein
MAMLVGDIINKARIDLMDKASPYRWPDADMIGYLNEGMKLVAILKTSASLVTNQVALSAGTRQELPSGGLVPVRFGPNISSGNVIGKVPAVVGPGVLDGMIPDWNAHPANATVKFAVFSPDIPKAFWVYPPQPVSTAQKLEITYSALPAKVTATTDNIPLADEYEPALIDYVLYRAFAKDSEAPEALGRSQMSLSGFSTKLGLPVPAVKRAIQQQQQGATQ